MGFVSFMERLKLIINMAHYVILCISPAAKVWTDMRHQRNFGLVGFPFLQEQ